MQGTSRTSLALLQEQLAQLAPQRAATTGTLFEDGSLARDLLSLSSLLGREGTLRAALTSTGTSPESKAELVRALFADRLGAQAVTLLTSAAQARWSRARDFVDALELLGAEAAFSQAEAAGTLPRVEEELFRVSRAIVGSEPLRTALSDPAVPAAARTQLVRDLIGQRADPTTVAVVEHVVVSSRGRRVEDVLEQFVELASSRRSERIAEVGSPVALSPEQEQRLTEALGRLCSAEVRLQLTIDPTLRGGIVVRVGDEVIDGSVANRLDRARSEIVR